MQTSTWIDSDNLLEASQLESYRVLGTELG